MSRLGDISVAIQEWVVTALSGSTELGPALSLQAGETVASRLWDSPPPPDASLPYVYIQVVEPRDIGGVGLAEVMARAEVVVKAVDRAESYEEVGPVAQAIHAALQGRRGVPLNGGGTMLSSRRLRAVSYPEQTDGVEYRHLGGTYEVFAR